MSGLSAGALPILAALASMSVAAAVTLSSQVAQAVSGATERVQGGGKVVAPRWYNEAHVAHGAKVFARHCAGCHGERGEGAHDWRRRDANGNLPPPPLNGTGHTWHHPSAVLLKVIMEGSPGGGNMPAWAGVISANDAAAAIAWFQSQWPDEIYAAWYRIETQAHERE